jgi:hypothetical protein
MFLEAADYAFIGHRLKELISCSGQGVGEGDPWSKELEKVWFQAKSIARKN